MILPNKAWVLLETSNRTHVYCKIMRILITLSQFLTSSKNHGIHLIHNVLALHSAQDRKLQGIRAQHVLT
jgi:glutamyl-tRNA reductase